MINKIKNTLKNKNLIIVSNREPFTHYQINSKIILKENIGGLVSSLVPIMEKIKGLWIAWGPTEADFKVLCQNKIKVPNENGFTLRRIKIPLEDVKHYYTGFSNSILWPNAHLFSDKCIFSEKDWQAYKKVNKLFASAVLEEIKNNDLIWVHDYQLTLVPKYIKEKKKNAKIAFFWHIPFPPYEIFSHLCYHWRRSILEGMLSCNLIGFHTQEYVENFMKSAEKILNAKIKKDFIIYNKKKTKVKAFPLGINYENFHHIDSHKLKYYRKKLNLENKILILGVDRLDYTKGIVERLWAIRDILEKNEHLRKRIVFIQIATPTRTKVKEYQNLKRKIDRLVGEINSKYSDPSTGLSPVRYYYRAFTQKELTLFYSLADIALITPLADGMNLVAKEYIATTKRGILILSESAGASKQLREALIVNPRDIPQVCKAIETAIHMPEKEKLKRLSILKNKVKKQDIWWWLNNFFREWLS
jgi:trehalose 6-phosphate synthase